MNDQDWRRLQRIKYEFQHGKPHGVSLEASFKFDMADTDRLSPEQLTALMKGIAQVLIAESALGRPQIS